MGAYDRFMRDLTVHDNVKLENYLRMDQPDVFEDRFLLVVIIIILFIHSCLFVIFQSQDVSEGRVWAVHWDWLALRVDP